MSKLRIATLALVALVMSVLLAACGGPGSNNVVPGSNEGTHDLNVSVQGPGTVVIEAIDFSCSDECTTRIGAGVAVELAAQADSGKGFVGWQQACSGTGTCTVPMDGDANVTAVFADNVLSLDMAGDGSGTVRIVPPDVNCQGDCTQGYPGPVSVSLTVTLSEGTRVEGWGADCSDSGTTRQCVVDVSGQTDVSLTLVQPPVANPDSYSTDEDQTLSVSAGNGVLSNDSDAGGGSLAAVLVSRPSEGELDFDADGSFTYTPGEPGDYSFSYRARDGSGNLSNTTQVTITVRRLPRHTLTVDKAGSGDGSVTSDPSGIDCGGDCSEEFKQGTSVTLTADPADNSTFAGWSGACSGQGNTCTVGMNAAKEVTARFELALFPLTTSVEGPGTVTSSPGGINCGSDCESEYSPGTTVTLTATPDPGSTFEGWGNACSGASGPTCQVEMTQGRSVSASFAVEEEEELTVDKTGSGSGSVTSDPSGIDCGSDCSGDFKQGTSVTLTADPADNSSFAGWSGACSGQGTTCTVDMNEAKEVTARFELALFPLTTSVEGPGTGTITSDDGGIDCEPDCASEYSYGTAVTLTATPDTGSTFEGWGGACSGASGQTCQVEMTQGRSVSASFAVERTLTTTTTGEGQGSITSSPTGIDCGGDCNEPYPHGTDVTLTASADEGSTFAGWAGDCSGASSNTCELDMTADKDVSAAFTVDEPPPPVQFTLDVDRNGDGSGSIAGPGISCPGDCTEIYDETTEVTLTADPAEGSELEGWSGGCDDETDERCTVTMDADKAVTATFNAVTVQHLLNVTVAGDGSGTVDGPGIACPGDCEEQHDEGTPITLTADPGEDSVLESWSGCDNESNGDCTLSMDSEENVTATFSQTVAQFPLHVTLDGDGSVASDDEKINCPDTCDAEYDEGDTTTLTATPANESEFDGWSGACTDSENPCTITIDGEENVTASFSPLAATFTLDLQFDGDGSGSVAIEPSEAGTCGDDCTESYEEDTGVTLTAQPDMGSVYAWGGDCSMDTDPCELVMNANKSVTISFDADGGADDGDDETGTGSQTEG